MKTARILVIDDEDTLCEVLRFNLEVAGYKADVANSAEEAMEKFPLSRYNLILLDVMMGQVDGFTFARKLKESPSTANIPIIFLTAKDNEEDMMTGFDIGADDYIYKPYTIRNVVSRVTAVLRRTHFDDSDPSDPNSVIYVEDLKIDPTLKAVYIEDREIKMPRKEFEILRLLVSNPGRVFTREEILSKVWGENVVVVDRVVDVNITRLRRKLGEYGNKILTRSGYGYGFEP